MTIATSSIPYYVSLDVDHDVSGDTLKVTLDKTQTLVNWVTATYGAPSAALIAEALTKKATPAGFTRYWWKFYSGSTTGQVPLVFGNNTVHGQLSDTPADFRPMWTVYAHNE